MSQNYTRIGPNILIEKDSGFEFIVHADYIEYRSQSRFAHILATTINNGIAEARFILLSDIQDRNE